MTVTPTIPDDHSVNGTCGNCGGPVVIPRMWPANEVPPEKCANCGARPKQEIEPKYGPIKEMA